MRQHWPEIEALAEALLQKGRLAQNEVLAMLAPPKAELGNEIRRCSKARANERVGPFAQIVIYALKRLGSIISRGRQLFQGNSMNFVAHRIRRVLKPPFNLAPPLSIAKLLVY
jgi:hypothetical protein